MTDGGRTPDRQKAPPRPVADLLAGLAPRRWPGAYVFNHVTGLEGVDANRHIALLREDEGWTLVTECRQAKRLSLADEPRFAAVTLGIDSRLDEVGLTAAVAGALAEAGIPCNVLAGFHHDHLFIPLALADRGMACLRALSRRHGARTTATANP